MAIYQRPLSFKRLFDLYIATRSKVMGMLSRPWDFPDA